MITLCVSIYYVTAIFFLPRHAISRIGKLGRSCYQCLPYSLDRLPIFFFEFTDASSGCKNMSAISRIKYLTFCTSAQMSVIYYVQLCNFNYKIFTKR